MVKTYKFMINFTVDVLDAQILVDPKEIVTGIIDNIKNSLNINGIGAVNIGQDSIVISTQRG
jgi:hypothetical protein